jgi:hypothetical protein
MAVFIVVWIFLLLVTYQLGATIVYLTGSQSFNRIGDRFIISTWLGIIILSNALLAISIFSRLSLAIMVVVCIVLTMSSLLLSKKNHLLELKPYLSPGIVVGFFVMLAGISFVSTQIITWYDTGGYHFGIIKWLSQYGSVPGLALLYYGFGYTSAWFALAAPFNNWILDARACALTGGFAFLIMMLHFWICLTRFFLNHAKKEDWFIVISLFLAITVIVRFEIFVSPSQDLPVIILTIAVAWVMIITGKNSDEISSRGYFLRESDGYILLILSAGAVSIKLSAVPLILISSCYYLLSGKISVRKVKRYIIICMVVLAPFLAVQVITSGCFLYPSSILCLDLPWTIGPEKLQEVTEQIRKAAQWSSITPPAENSFNWIFQWIYREKFQVGILLFTLASYLLSIGKIRNNFLKQITWPIALGVVGFFYSIFIGPTWRYNLGYISILPATFLSFYFYQHAPVTYRITSWSHNESYNKWVPFILLILLTIIILSASYIRNNTNSLNFLRIEIKDAIKNGDLHAEHNNWKRLILPPKIINYYIGIRNTEKFGFTVQNLQVSMQKMDNFVYYKPQEGYQCWDSDLPCSQFLTYDKITLRNSKAGLSGGFVRIETD